MNVSDQIHMSFAFFGQFQHQSCHTVERRLADHWPLKMTALILQGAHADAVVSTHFNGQKRKCGVQRSVDELMRQPTRIDFDSGISVRCRGYFESVKNMSFADDPAPNASPHTSRSFMSASSVQRPNTQGLTKLYRESFFWVRSLLGQHRRGRSSLSSRLERSAFQLRSSPTNQLLTVEGENWTGRKTSV